LVWFNYGRNVDKSVNVCPIMENTYTFASDERGSEG
jgi:hypothetical protein